MWYLLLVFLAAIVTSCSESPTTPSSPVSRGFFGLASTALVPPRTDGLGLDSLWKRIAGDSLVVVGLKNPGTSRGFDRDWLQLPTEFEEHVQSLRHVGVEIVRRDDRLPVVIARVPSREALQWVMSRPFVDYAEPYWLNISLSEPGCSVERKEMYATRVENSRFVSAYNDTMPQSFLVHNIDLAWWRSSGRGITVSNVDTGIDPEQTELNEAFASGASINRTKRYDASSDADAGPVWSDNCGHGTRMAGLTAGPLNGIGSVGVAWGANYVAIRQDDDVIVWSSDDASDAINLAAGTFGARVVIMAWGRATGRTGSKMRSSSGTMASPIVCSLEPQVQATADLINVMRSPSRRA